MNFSLLVCVIGVTHISFTAGVLVQGPVEAGFGHKVAADSVLGAVSHLHTSMSGHSAYFMT